MFATPAAISTGNISAASNGVTGTGISSIITALSTLMVSHMSTASVTLMVPPGLIGPPGIIASNPVVWPQSVAIAQSILLYANASGYTGQALPQLAAALADCVYAGLQTCVLMPAPVPATAVAAGGTGMIVTLDSPGAITQLISSGGMAGTQGPTLAKAIIQGIDTCLMAQSIITFSVVGVPNPPPVGPLPSPPIVLQGNLI